ncbi:MFS transporter, partial [Salmonella enterica subsp. enterica serovar Typhimurium]|nr:MFS transporter [Salmonella enterica subsp. enterica serovar Typhimurium]
QWVLTSYLLALCATMTASAWVIDRLGPRLTFIASMTMFLIGSVMCALSDSVWQLVTGRTISGAGAGILVPTASVLL